MRDNIIFRSSTNSSGKRRMPQYKTEFCEEYKKGRCNYGDDCSFAHSRQELRSRKDPYGHKTQLCENFSRDGRCSYGKKCNFAHGAEELKKRHSPSSKPSSSSSFPIPRSQVPYVQPMQQHMGPPMGMQQHMGPPMGLPMGMQQPMGPPMGMQQPMGPLMPPPIPPGRPPIPPGRPPSRQSPHLSPSEFGAPSPTSRPPSRQSPFGPSFENPPRRGQFGPPPTPDELLPELPGHIDEMYGENEDEIIPRNEEEIQGSSSTGPPQPPKFAPSPPPMSQTPVLTNDGNPVWRPTAIEKSIFAQRDTVGGIPERWDENEE